MRNIRHNRQSSDSHRLTAPRNRSDSNRRRGAAMVEFAICLPILMTLVIGSIEAANLIHLKQALEIASFEAARVGTSTGGTEADARAAAEEILTAFQIDDATIAVVPSITEVTAPGTVITVSITAPSNSNSISPQWFGKDSNLTGSAAMARL